MILPTGLTPGMQRVLENLKADETFLPKWHQLVDLLIDSKFYLFLQELGRVQSLSYDTPNYIQAQAVEAGRANGVNQVLDWMLNFRDVLAAQKEVPKIPFEFSGPENALSTGDITKEELDAIRNDQPIPDYQFEQPRFLREQQPGAPVKDAGDKA